MKKIFFIIIFSLLCTSLNAETEFKFYAKKASSTITYDAIAASLALTVASANPNRSDQNAGESSGE